jgi:septal ring factor EnvC (AmiA/AmiB activator)
MGRLGLAAFLALVMACGVAVAQTASQVRQAEQARAAEEAARAAAEARASTARAEEQRLATARVAAAARSRDLEAATLAAANRVASLAERQREQAARLQAASEELAPILPVMERLALYPAETLLAVPLPPEQAVRGLLVMGAIGRRLEADAAAVRAGQAEAARLARDVAAEMPALTHAQVEQAQAAAALDGQIAEARRQRQAAEGDAAEAARRSAIEAAKAESLHAALERLEAERRAAEEQARAEAAAAQRHRQEAAVAAARRRQEALAAPAGPGLAEGHAQLTAPVGGAVTRGWGEGGGGVGSGITFAAAPGARVVAPCSGRVVFASPFRSYGLLLIVDCGGGWHAVLAGLERFDVEAGDGVRAGEPVGVMPGWDPRASAPRPGLYLELRKGGQPVNPTPYLRASS